MINNVSDTLSMTSGFDNFDNVSMDSCPDSEYNFKDLNDDGEEMKINERDLDSENIGVDNSRLVKQFRKRIVSSQGRRPTSAISSSMQS
jgi:hypothetical protein